MSDFRSFLHSANGKACSPVGTFGTSRRKNDLRTTCGSDSFFNPPDGLDAVCRNSKGVWRTQKRFTPLADDASPGPIYKIPDEISRVKGPSWGKPTHQRAASSDAQRRGDGQGSFPLIRRGADTRTPSLTLGSLPTTLPDTVTDPSFVKCTFGQPHPTAMPDKVGTTVEVPMSYPHLAHRGELPNYKGRWGSPPKQVVVREEEERRRRAKDAELMEILKQGYQQRQAYRSSTPSFSMGTRAAAIPARVQTPGPGEYNVFKFKKDGRPDAPTFLRKGHDLLEFQSGRDSPGPALYSQMRYPQ